MKQFLFALFLLFSGASSFAQAVDSIAIDTSVNPHTFFVRVRFPSQYYTLARAYAGVSPDNGLPVKYLVSLVFKECNQSAGPTSYDSTFEYSFGGGAYPLSYIVGTYVYLDTNTVDTNCGYRMQPLQIDNDGFYISSSTATRILETELSGISFFPNPATSVITLQNSGNFVLRTLRLYNITGQLLLDEPCNKGAFSIAHLPSGVYSAVIETDSGPVYQKLLIQH